MAVEEITVEQLAERLAADPTLRIVDVREPDEFAEVRVPAAVSIPLSTVPDHLDELRAASGDLIMICRGGGRSLQACEFLDQNGVEATNVAGGTMAWILAGHETAKGPISDASDSVGNPVNAADDSSGAV